MTERWVEIPDFPNYMVSSLGCVWSKERIAKSRSGRTRKHAGRILSPFMLGPGYPAVTLLSGDARPVNRFIHVLVASAFIGPRPARMVVAHGDGNKSNNRAENLRYATAKENAEDSERHGTRVKGERQGKAKLTADAVMRIRASQGTHRAIADEFGISPLYVPDIIGRKTWKHVP